MACIGGSTEINWERKSDSVVAGHLCCFSKVSINYLNERPHPARYVIHMIGEERIFEIVARYNYNNASNVQRFEAEGLFMLSQLLS